MRAETLARQFWDKAVPEPNSGCFLWIGSIWPPGHRTSYGYGQVRRNGRLVSAHRVAWELTNGAIPSGLLVLHHCDVTCCVNPDHLFLGTYADNIADMVQKGRGNYTACGAVTGHLNMAKTHCPHGHPYDTDNTYKREDGKRSCRTCHRDRMRVWRVHAQIGSA